MARFDAGQAVESLEYDFTAYGGNAGAIKEPSTGQVNAFFNGMKTLFKEVRQIQNSLNLSDTEMDKMSEEEISEAMAKIDEAESGASEYQTRSLELLAELCGAKWEDVTDDEGAVVDKRLVGGAPTLDELNDLPYRVLTAFSQWLIKEIQPKKTTPVTRR